MRTLWKFSFNINNENNRLLKGNENILSYEVIKKFDAIKEAENSLIKQLLNCYCFYTCMYKQSYYNFILNTIIL